MKSPNRAAPCSPERQKINFEKETDGSESDNCSQRNDDVSAKTTNTYASAAFFSPMMSKLFKKSSTAKTGYYGPLIFLARKEEFNATVGIQPRMYHAFAQDEEAHDARRELERFVDACKLDVFISVC